MHLLQFLHQVGLGVQAAGSIDQECCSPTCVGRHHGVVCDRRRIGSVFAGDHIGIEALPQVFN